MLIYRTTNIILIFNDLNVMTIEPLSIDEIFFKRIFWENNYVKDTLEFEFYLNLIFLKLEDKINFKKFDLSFYHFNLTQGLIIQI